MKYSLILATGHALLAFLLGLYLAATARDAGKLIPVVGYIMTSEVLWRMSHVALFWEFGKYSTSAILLLWIMRHPTPRPNWLALIYLLLLIPSVIITCFSRSDFTHLRQILSFNLSGPFALAVCSFCFYRMNLQYLDFHRLLVMMLGPLVGIAATCSLATLSLGAGYKFGSQSNLDTSGGFGPNQVSALLGLGMLVAFLWIFVEKSDPKLRLPGVILIFYFFAQSALTFSRTGIYMGVGTIVVASLCLLRDPERLLYGTGILTVLFGVGYLLLFPALDQFTGRKLSVRFADTGLSHREEIARADFDLATQHPFLGVGVGMAQTARLKALGIEGAAHTEFTRMLAEHGVLGAISLVALLVMGIRTALAAATKYEMAWAAALLAYSLLFMTVSGMRLVAPATTMGLSMLRLRKPQPRLAAGRNVAQVNHFSEASIADL